jgi:hypothetical protein
MAPEKKMAKTGSSSKIPYYTEQTIKKLKRRMIKVFIYLSVTNNNIPLILTMDNSSSGKRPCRFFNREEGCKKGAACEFSHEPAAKKFTPICRFFAKGTCNKEDACEFRHVVKKTQKPCSFFAAGSCKKGDKCDFKHVKPDASSGGTTGAVAMDLNDE